MDRIENTLSNSSPIVTSVFIAMGHVHQANAWPWHAHREQGDLIRLLLFFQNKESRLKIYFYNLLIYNLFINTE
jgi:hypothetical protein